MGNDHHPEHEDHGHNEVQITVNGTDYSIDRGSQTVMKIKQVAGVALAEELEQVVDGKLTPLPDDGRVTLKGGEVFLSHVRSGGSS